MTIIRKIYLYLFSLIGLVLVVIGCVQLVNLGLKAYIFTAPTISIRTRSRSLSEPCAANDTACQTERNAADAQYQAVQTTYQDHMQAYQSETQVYNRNLFIIANIIGIVVFALGFWLLFATSMAAQSVPVGIMAAGLWAIMYGYVAGWSSVNDQLKFFIGLVIALLVLGGSIWLVDRYQKKRAVQQ